MVKASHVILGMYGFWLPNDERGSWSDFVGSWELLRFGKATTVNVRQFLPVDHLTRPSVLRLWRPKYPPVKLTGIQARAIGRGFAECAAETNLEILACAILPQHIHLVLKRHRLKVEQLVNQLKGAATRRLVEEKVHPQAAFQRGKSRPPKAFARSQWKVFLNTSADIRRSVQYVENNPLREDYQLSGGVLSSLT